MKRTYTYTDAELRRLLGTELPGSPLIEGRIQAAYSEIRDRADRRSRRKKRGLEKGGGAGSALRWMKAGLSGAAVLMAAVIFWVSGSSMAEELPAGGGIFGKLWGLFTYGGVPEEETVSLQGAQTTETAVGEGAPGRQEAGGTDGQDGDVLTQYQAADQGLTVTLSEYYASNQSILVGVRVESEKPFPEFAFMQNEPHRQILTAWTEERYSFRDAGDEQINGARQIEGRLVDDHTFEGVMRIDYDSIRVDSRKYDRAYEEGERAAKARGEAFAGVEVTEENYDDWFGQYELPGNFRMELAITKLKGYVSSGAYKAAGRWEFTEPIEITRDVKAGTEICVNETNEAGWGLASVEVSPGEVTVHVISPEMESGWAAVLDKDGRPLVRGVNADQFGAYGRNLSELTVYVCDFETWTDIKSEAYRAGGDSGGMDEALYRQLLEERAQYRKVLCP